jgi:phage tail sheath protein FI
MGEYLHPGVYVEDSPSVPSMEGAGASTGGFIGVAQRGKIGEAVFCASWDDYIRNFAEGMATPFMAGSDLAYSVYGFFQNGGRRCYVIRAATASAAAAEADALFRAKDPGAWGNDLKVMVSRNENYGDGNELYDIVVRLKGAEVEAFRAVGNVSGAEGYWADELEKSAFVAPVTGSIGDTTPVEKELSGGADGTDGIADGDFSGRLALFDVVDDVNLLAIPGQTTAAVTSALLAYAEGRGNVFALIDGPKATDIAGIKAFRRTVSCGNAALYYPWIKIADPLSRSGKLRTVPTAGHVMGVYARTISERGVWKAAAGTEAAVRGALDVATVLGSAAMDTLNPMGVNAVIPKAGYGIVVWGARSLSPDSSMRYASDALLDIYIKKSTFDGTQQFTFEPNGERTWGRLATAVEAFLDDLWRSGGLAGAAAAEAYRVRCDAGLNPQASRDAGKLVCEVAYAPLKPAEFIVFRFSHTMQEA